MSKAKAKTKSGTGQGTGKKGWNRWKAGANKAKSFSRTPAKIKKPTNPKQIKNELLKLNGSMHR